MIRRSESALRSVPRTRLLLSPIGLYEPGTSPLHKLGPAPKLLGLAVTGIAITVISSSWTPVAAVLLAIGAIRLARLPLWSIFTRLRLILVFALGLTLYHAWATTWQQGASLSMNLIALVLLAAVFTATTRSDDLISIIVRAMTQGARVPLVGRFIRPQSIALAVSIMLRTIPTVSQIHAETLDAARARGLERTPRALLVPLVLRTVAQAHATGHALHARGVLDVD